MKKLKNKKIILILVIGVALIFTFWFIQFGQSREFVGNLSDVKENSIIVEGRFKSDDADPALAEFFAAELIINSQTKIKKIVLYLPSQEELKKTGGMFKVDQLKKDETDVDFRTLKEDFGKTRFTVGVEAKVNYNTFKPKKFETKEIIYRLPFQE